MSYVMAESGGFTGVLLERDGPKLAFVRTVEVGRNDGPCFYRLDTGGIDRGPSHEWDEPGTRGYTEAVRLTDLVFGDRVTYAGEPYAGTVVLVDVDGGCRARILIEGHGFGFFRVRSPVGGFLGQGVRGRVRGRAETGWAGGLYGPVGSWRRWDERGRLLREVVYDALWNRLIRRELDERGDIVERERYEPAVWMEDPVTGSGGRPLGREALSHRDEGAEVSRRG